MSDAAEPSRRSPALALGAGRIEAVDAARGAALLAMAIYHFSWDLSFFQLIATPVATDPAWKWFARAIAGSFLFLVGVSLVLGHRERIRWRALHPPRRDDRRRGRGGDGRHIFRISRKLHLLRHPALHRAVERAGAAVPAAALAAGDGERGARARGAAPRRPRRLCGADARVARARLLGADHERLRAGVSMVRHGARRRRRDANAAAGDPKARAVAGRRGPRPRARLGRAPQSRDLSRAPADPLGRLYPVALLFPPGPTAQAAPFLRQCERTCTSAGRSAPACARACTCTADDSSGATSGRVPCATSSPRPSARPPARSPEGASSPSRSAFRIMLQRSGTNGAPSDPGAPTARPRPIESRTRVRIVAR